MTITTHQGSARIYHFPLGGRAGSAAQRDTAALMETIRAPVAASSGWYHDAAIADAVIASDPAGKPQ